MTQEQWDSVKYFVRGEFVSPDTLEEDMSYDLLKFLEALREYCGFPVVINSAYRSPDHNAAVGGSEDSSHLRGLAADVKCISSFQRWKILSFVMNWQGAGRIIRVGIARTFIHIDIDNSLLSPVMWVY